MNMNMQFRGQQPDLWHQQMTLLRKALPVLDDKPEETPTSCLAALWLTDPDCSRLLEVMP